MENDFSDHPPRDEYCGALAKFYEACKISTLSELVEANKLLPGLFPERFPLGRATTYTQSTFSRVLRGRHKGLPTSSFVTEFVLSCLVVAQKNGPFSGVSADEILDCLQERLRAAEQRSEELGLFIRRGFRAVERANRVPRFRPATAPAEGRTVPPRELPPAQKEWLRRHTPYGRVILDRLGQGDAEAYYQAGLLLSARAGDEILARWLIVQAATAYHPQALELLEESSWRRLNRAVARIHAEVLTDEAFQADYHDAARTFAKCIRQLDALTWDGGMPLAAPTQQPETPS